MCRLKTSGARQTEASLRAGEGHASADVAGKSGSGDKSACSLQLWAQQFEAARCPIFTSELALGPQDLGAANCCSILLQGAAGPE